MLRPVLLGLVLDMSDRSKVLAGMTTLANAWGGCFGAILPDDEPSATLRERFDAFELDALWLFEEQDELRAQLNEQNMLWRGGGDWGPLSEGRYSHGLLPWRALDGSPFVIPPLTDPLLEWLATDQRAGALHLVDLKSTPAARLARVRSHADPIVLLLDKSQPRHLAAAWNIRSTAAPLACVDLAMATSDQTWDELANWCQSQPHQRRDHQQVRVWDLHAPSRAAVHDEIVSAIAQTGESVTRYAAERSPSLYRRILTTDFISTFDISMPYGTMRSGFALPRLPLGDDGAAPGDFRTVAAEVHLRDVTDHDPRLAVRLPEDPRFADLLDFTTEDIARVRRPTQYGYVAGVGATASSMNVQLHRKSEVFRRLLGPADVEVGQSDVGLFQTRTAELLGDPYGDLLVQPGCAAVLKMLAAHPGGVPLARLREEFRVNRGHWPQHLASSSVKEYIEAVLRRLVGTGLVRALLRVKCSYCRAGMQIDADAVSSSLVCDFCSQEVLLAPLVAWGSPKWMFRLAGHLAAADIQAMVPALATVAQLARLSGVYRGMDCAELGVTVRAEGRSTEVDVAAYLPSPIPVTVLGEVKGRNRIDSKDIGNLEWVQDMLDANGFDSLVLFATTKDDFGPEERMALRDHCERRAVVMDVRRAQTPRLPLLLTGKDLFLPTMHDDSVERWAKNQPALAIHGTAFESCERNLGLAGWRATGGEVEFDWGELASAT